jgi:uncharacterized membrane protein YedE/YeeE
LTTATHVAAIVSWCAFGVAFAVGAISHRTNFCTLGAVSDIFSMGDWGRMRMWLLAIAVAILGTQALYAAGLIDLSKSFYVRPGFTWLSHTLGGFLFGIGMTLSSGCGSRTLVRIGGGNVKSVVVLMVLGIASYMTMKGLFGVWRVNYLDSVAIDFAAHGAPMQDLPTLLAVLFGMEKTSLALVLSSIAGGGILLFVFWDREFRKSADHVLGGTAWGLAVVAGWYISGHIGFGENPDTLENVFFATNSRAIESLSFIAPIAYSLELLLLWSDKSLIVTFGIATTSGLILGSLAHALAARKFRWEGFTTVEDLKNHLLGGALMGFGGVTAMGCTIGQGVSGFSTLALGSIVTFLSIVAGCAATLKYQYWKLIRG